MEPEKKVTTDLVPKNTDPISFFDKDADFVFVYKKTEKLASAIYMITNLFSDNEPMKWTLRKKVSDLLSFVLVYKNISEANQIEFVHNLKTKVLEVTSLLDIAMRGGLISEMNHGILRQEFSNLAEVVNKVRISVDFTPVVIPKNFFELDQKNLNQRHDYGTMTNLSHSSIKDKNDVSNVGGLKRTNRQNIILGLLKKKRELTIKDIAQVIKDCSEKTIQRELISFISEGILKRTGERRWSKYSLNGDQATM